ncbi:MAG: hypothetical protein O3B32_04730 [Cyanobacteria bacterium]|nr:hypothetical protein [Cyanobacteriota bacterium]
MADDTPPSQPRTDRGGRSGGDRPAGNREPGGFRIRLSDNEMRAAQAIQESFGLRSTVAALGFAIRTVAQLLEEGQLEGLVAQQRAQGDRAPGERSQGERRSGAGDGRLNRQERAPRIDPFARPSKPAPPSPEPETPSPEQTDGALPAEEIPGSPEPQEPDSETSEG